MDDSSRYRSILLFGPPGAGKGTQGKILGSVPGFFHLSVGDVFRSIDIGSPTGQQIYKYTSNGQLVPDELTVEIWKKTVDAYVALSTYKPREDLLVLDGIPTRPPKSVNMEPYWMTNNSMLRRSCHPKKWQHYPVIPSSTVLSKFAPFHLTQPPLD